MKFITLILFSVVISIYSAQSLPCFFSPVPPVQYSTNIYPNGIVSIDLNLDGNKDIVCPVSGGFDVLKSNGTTGLLPSVNYPIASGVFLAAGADINSDGFPDIATTSNNGSLCIALGSATGTFGAITTFSTLISPNAIHFKDFNNDGATDIAVLSAANNNIALHLGTGTGSFAPVNAVTLTSSLRSETSDINSDGNADFIFITAFGQIVVYTGLGNGTFNSAVYYTIPGATPYDLEVKDVNADGFPDVIASYSGPSGIAVLMGSSSGTLAAATQYTTGGNLSVEFNITTTDLNNDGNIDIVCGGGEQLITMMGNGSGGFTLNNSFGDGNDMTHFALGDFDIDGKIDVAIFDVINLYGIRIVKGRGDGTFAFPLLFKYAFPNTSMSGMLAHDANGDGLKDLFAPCNLLNNNTLLSIMGSTNSILSRSGVFTPIPSSGNTANSSQIEKSDFNNDGFADLVIEQSNRFDIMMGSATGTFGTAVPYLVPPLGNGGTRGLTVGDFNADSYEDIAVVLWRSISGPATSSLMIFNGTSVGTFSSSSIFPFADYGETPVAGDFNNDTYPDLAVGGQQISILYGSGTGTFSSPTNYTTMPGVNLLKIANMNGDNIPDLVAVARGSLSAPILTFSVQILLGTTSGTFSASTIFTASGWPRAMDIADFNFDSFQDVVVGSLVNSGLSFFMGNGTGSLSPAPPIKIPDTVVAIEAEDFNQDNRVDIAVLKPLGSVLLLLNGLPNVQITGPSSVCAGNAVALNVSSTHSYTWNNGSTLSQQTYTPNSTTSYSVVSTSSLGCTNAVSKQVTVNPNPTLSINSGSICVGNSYSLVPSGASSYTISGGSYNVSPTITATYTLSGTNVYGCVAQTPVVATVVTAALPLPTISVNSGSICEGNSFTIVPSGAVNYTITGGAYTVSPVISTNYTVTGANTFGCVNKDTVVSSLTVTPAPIITANSSSICIGDSFTISPSGAQSYSFSSGTAVVSPSINSTYTVNGQNLLGCANLTPCIVTVTVLSRPTISVSGGTICEGQSFVFSPSGATSYSYSGASATVSPSNTETFSVIGIDTNGCASSPATTVQVNVNPSPILNVTSTKFSICIGESVILKASGASQFVWDNMYSGDSLAVTPTITTVYYVVGTSSLGCTSNDSIKQIVDQCLSFATAQNSLINSKLYPNPGNGNIRLDLNDAATTFISVLKSDGELLFTTDSKGLKSTELNLTAFPPGLYLIVLTEADKSITYRYVKK